MTREQFLALAGQLYDAQNGGGGGTGDGRAPQWDTQLPAGPGEVIYASECSAKELQYQISKANKPPKDPKWLEANQKRARALGYWLAYRQGNPSVCWSGSRNRVSVTAAAPSDRPAKYQKPAYSNDAAPEPEPVGGGSFDDSDIPFAPIGDVG